ncbi:MAG TPA: fused MFS/spermidine synthase [Candidatus Limnocylindrales bacterium]|nr:fused MFS/spermidine synthase [Candidatus Limnocylindrales bacterium]
MGAGLTVDGRDARVTLLFAATIALSALLLFTVEPLVGRLALPVFGGTPGVWATTLAFFQGILLVGYAYAHVLLRVGSRRAAAVHVPVVAISFAAGAAALAVRAADLRADALPDVLNVVVLLAVLVGLPAFALSATTPLLSDWYTRTTGRDPYWLYAVSNAASLVGLLAYPVAIEPALGLASQRIAWAGGLAVLGALLVATAIAVGRAGRNDERSFAPRARQPLDGGALRRVRWGLLAAVPAGLLAAVTNVIATDVVSAPLLWVVPLAIYLATLVVAFSARAPRVRRAAVVLAPAAVTLLWVPTGSVGAWPIAPLVALEWLSFAVVALALHVRLADDRPPSDRLTDFYLVLSAGGVVGGAFVGIVAPSVFPGIWELPILLVLGLVAVAWSGGPLVPAPPDGEDAGGTAGISFDPRPFLRGAPARLGPYLAATAVVAITLLAERSLATIAAFRSLLVGALVLLAGGEAWFLALATAIVLVLATFVLPDPALLRARSYFGVTEVVQPPGEGRTVLYNGTTVHGSQWIDPARRDEPVGYYVRTGPLGEVFAALDAVRPGPRTVGVVGLGAGGISPYARAGDDLTFFEIDPVVVDVASDGRYFTYLADAATRPHVVLGDGRLSLSRIASGTFDVLILDAFSSDSVPAHLLTVEAIADDARTLRPGGLLLAQISTRYYDLEPAVAAAAIPAGLAPLHRNFEPSVEAVAAGATASEWVAATTDAGLSDRLRAAGWATARVAAAPLTDDHPDVLRFLRP